MSSQNPDAAATAPKAPGGGGSGGDKLAAELNQVKAKLATHESELRDMTQKLATITETAKALEQLHHDGQLNEHGARIALDSVAVGDSVVVTMEGGWRVLTRKSLVFICNDTAQAANQLVRNAPGVPMAAPAAAAAAAPAAAATGPDRLLQFVVGRVVRLEPRKAGSEGREEFVPLPAKSLARGTNYFIATLELEAASR